jgi:CubicO group peptidase (beta-lactamase class C family)
MDMRSGVRFSEVYTDPDSDITKFDFASGWKPRASPDDPPCVFDLILGVEQDRDHGGAFQYRSIETDVMAFCMERATGRRLADLVSEELWSRLGVEEDACFTVDPAGYALASGGFNACLRDYARFGLMHLNMGVFNGRQIVPAEWVARCRTGDHAVFGAPYTEVLPNGAYRNQFWIEDVDRRAYMARGVFGQLIHIDPDNDMVAVKLSTWPDFQNTRFNVSTLLALRAIGRALND